MILRILRKSCKVKPFFKKLSDKFNAYMLVYVRTALIESIPFDSEPTIPTQVLESYSSGRTGRVIKKNTKGQEENKQLKIDW